MGITASYTFATQQNDGSPQLPQSDKYSIVTRRDGSGGFAHSYKIPGLQIHLNPRLTQPPEIRKIAEMNEGRMEEDKGLTEVVTTVEVKRRR